MSDLDNWPDPDRSGVPANPERDGWHWLSWNGDPPDVGSWPPNGPEKRGPCWLWDGEWMGPKWVGPRARYLGPCLTPAEVAAAIAEEREACAALIEAHEEVFQSGTSTFAVQPRTKGNRTGLSFAAAIRARGGSDE